MDLSITGRPFTCPHPDIFRNCNNSIREPATLQHFSFREVTFPWRACALKRYGAQAGGEQGAGEAATFRFYCNFPHHPDPPLPGMRELIQCWFNGYLAPELPEVLPMLELGLYMYVFPAFLHDL
jgi:hypothetical protein